MQDERSLLDELNEPLTEPPAATLDRASEDGDTDGEPVFPPTDPVLTIDERGDPQVLGGFNETSMEEVTVARSTDGQPGDEALADAVRRELREDAMTTDLGVEVQVREGVAILRGPVADMVDAESAEEVAGRVPGVIEVMDRTEIVGS